MEKQLISAYRDEATKEYKDRTTLNISKRKIIKLLKELKENASNTSVVYLIDNILNNRRLLDKVKFCTDCSYRNFAVNIKPYVFLFSSFASTHGIRFVPLDEKLEFITENAETFFISISNVSYKDFLENDF